MPRSARLVDECRYRLRPDGRSKSIRPERAKGHPGARWARGPRSARGTAIGGRWHNGPMARTESRLLAGKRPKWMHLTMGVSLIVVAVALTVGWQILGTEVALVSRTGTWRWVIYFLGTLLFLLLIGGL